ncbi:hypothetical protein [Massilia sp. TSP1-1-2]|uniref:hypothetical protein n=1 Tax=Massilia sp. TSP1-1-2 TaxID=2804649 RepID=UPI003CEADFFF
MSNDERPYGTCCTCPTGDGSLCWPCPEHPPIKTTTPRLDPVVEANRELLHSRSQVGIAKYGVTLGEAKLPERDLLVHALQESLDLSNYLQANLQRLDAMPAAPAYEHDPMDIVRSLLCIVDRMAELTPAQFENYPSPCSEASPLMIAARAACVERGFTAGGLAIADLAGAPVSVPTSGAAGRDVLAERRRQVDVKDWTPEHDDHHPSGEIAAFAAVYAMPPEARQWPASETGYGPTFGIALCPQDWQPKFGDRRRELVKAGALILAEIERLDRASVTGAGGQS